MLDNISDMITRIRNGQNAKLSQIILFWPVPKICIKILTILKKEGYIRGYKFVLEKNKYCVIVLLKYTLKEKPLIKKIEKISCSGKRIFVKSTSFWKLNNGFGFYIISTPKGLYTDLEIRFLNLGGEVLLYIE